MSTVTTCDAPGCTHTRPERRRLCDLGWLTLSDDGGSVDFCSKQCAIKYLVKAGDS